MTEPKRVQTSDTGRRSLTEEGKRVVGEAAVAMAKREPTREARLALVRRLMETGDDFALVERHGAWLLAEIDRLQADHTAMHSAWKSEHSERVRLERENVRLTLERDEANARILESAQVSVERIVAEAGSIDVVLKTEILPMLVEMFAASFEEHDATNYLEMKAFHDRLGLLSVRIQKHDGITPHEARERAEARAKAARALLRRIREWDALDAAGDGDYWKREIDAVLSDNRHTPTDSKSVPGVEEET